MLEFRIVLSTNSISGIWEISRSGVNQNLVVSLVRTLCALEFLLWGFRHGPRNILDREDCIPHAACRLTWKIITELESSRRVYFFFLTNEMRRHQQLKCHQALRRLYLCVCPRSRVCLSPASRACISSTHHLPILQNLHHRTS